MYRSPNSRVRQAVSCGPAKDGSDPATDAPGFKQGNTKDGHDREFLSRGFRPLKGKNSEKVSKLSRSKNGV